MLQGKYIKYSEDITFEVFEKIINKIEGSGWNFLYREKELKHRFKSFGKYSNLVYSTVEKNYAFYSNDCIKSTDTELKVSDILSDELTVNDLVKGEIYKYDKEIIAIYPRGGSLRAENANFNPNENWLWVLKIKPATSHEKKWLKTCIKADKFIQESELDKYDDEGNLIETEFVLPEKWCIKITAENRSFCQKLKNKELGFSEDYNYTVGAYYGPIENVRGNLGSIRIEDRTEITFEQFKQYVLKEPIMYQALPFPDEDYFEAEVIEDIDPKELEIAGKCPFIPKGSKTWIEDYDFNRKSIQSNTSAVCPEANRWSANIPAKYFKIIDKVEEFKVGDWVTILSKTDIWSSVCNNNNINSKLTYPVTGQITKSQFHRDHLAIELLNGGWDLTHLVKNNNIRKATQSEIDAVIKPKSNIRNYYFEVSSQEEADKVFEYLKSIGEEVDYDKSNADYLPPEYKYVVSRTDETWWVGHETLGKTRKPLSDIIPELKEYYTKSKFKVGDKVIYKGKETIVVATHINKSGDSKYERLIVEYSDGWKRRDKDYSLLSGFLEPDKRYNYVSDESVTLIQLKSFDSCKIWIGDNPELSRKVQERLFELGYKWNDGEKVIKLTNKDWLVTWKSKTITFGEVKQHKQIFPEDLGIVLNTTTECPVCEGNVQVPIYSEEKPDKYGCTYSFAIEDFSSKSKIPEIQLPTNRFKPKQVKERKLPTIIKIN